MDLRYSADLMYPTKRTKFKLQMRISQSELRLDKSKQDKTRLEIYQNYYGATFCESRTQNETSKMGLY